LEELRLHFGSMVESIVLHLIADPESASDCCQEVWIRVAKAIGGLREPVKVRAWIAAVAINHARKRSSTLIEERDRFVHLGDVEWTMIPASGFDDNQVVDPADRTAFRAEVEAILSSVLPPAGGEGVTEGLLTGTPPRELGAPCGSNTNVFSVYLSRGRSVLRDQRDRLLPYFSE
jgi:DNA-directed RNA polymerase specialized sigma24 family protein